MDATIWRNPGEKQRPFVERVLHERGRFSVMDALYNCRYRDGSATALIRLAARIYELRAVGWSIDEHHLAGSAVYVLVSTPHKVVVENSPWPTAWLKLRETFG
jgi:hypothetical protein